MVDAVWSENRGRVSAGTCSAILLLEGNTLPERLSGIAHCQWKWEMAAWGFRAGRD